jgi:type I restriction enzyme, S subunit
MSSQTQTRPRAFAVLFKDLRLWSVGSFTNIKWHWPNEYIKPLSSAMKRVQAEVNRKEHSFDTLQLVTLHFDGTMEKRALDGKGQFKGKLFFARAGDVIYSKIDVRNGAIGIVPDDMPCVAVSSEFPVYSIDAQRTNSQYVKLLFRTKFFQQTINSMISGASGRKRVQPSQIETLEVPLPPLSVQRAIVEKWQRIQDEIKATIERIALDEKDVESVFFSSLGITPPEQVERPKVFSVMWSDLLRWSVRYVCDSVMGLDSLPSSVFTYSILGNVAQVSYGIQKSPANRPSQSARPYLRVANVRKGYLDLTEIKEINVPDSDMDTYRLAPGDILFVEGNGSRAELGRVAMWNDEIPDCVHQNHLIKVRCNPSKLLPKFAMFWFNTELGRSHFFRAAKTSSGLGTINSDEVRNAPIPLPPLEVQENVMALVEAKQAEIMKEREDAKRKAHESKTEVEALILGTKSIEDSEIAA